MSDPDPDPDRFVPASVAAHLSGVDPRTIRRWAVRGQVPVKPSARDRLVDLAAVRRLAGVLSGLADNLADTQVAPTRIVMNLADRADPVLDDDHDHSVTGCALHPHDPPDPNAEAFIRHIAYLEQTILQLSGHCGWLRSELQTTRAQLEAAHERIALLEAPKPEPALERSAQGYQAAIGMTNQSAPEQSGQDSACYERRSRRWWHVRAFW